MQPPRGPVRARWLSPRALLLHVGFGLLAAACLVAGWWQATRALAGNGLSWVYSVEWPIFAALAVAGWWQLIHEDPAAYRARKHGPSAEERAAAPAGAGSAAAGQSRAGLDDRSVRAARRLVVAVAVESVVGIVTLASLPFDRPTGFIPDTAAGLYLLHAALGLLIALGALALVAHVRHSTRLAKLVAWIGLTGVAVAGAGGLLTAGHSLVRFVGVACMVTGPLIAGFGYLVPFFLRPGAASGAAPR